MFVATYTITCCIRKLRNSRGLGQLIGVAHKRTLARTLQISKKKAVHVTYVQTKTNRQLFYLKYIPKVLQGLLKGKQSR